MRRLEKIGMKLTKKLFLSFFVLNLSFEVGGKTNQDLISYYQKIYEVEKNKFLNCVELENLSPDNKIYTSCEVSDSLEDALYILHNKKNTYDNHLEFLPEFKKYKKKNKTDLVYPRSMQERGISGYVIIEYDISESGQTSNHKVLKSMCGNLQNPIAKLSECSGFNARSISTAKAIKYHPTLFNGEPIKHLGAKHRFTYVMGQDKKIHLKSGAKSYNKVIKAIQNNDYKSALEIVNNNLDKDPYFLYQKAAIYFYKKEYGGSIDLFEDFFERVLIENKEIYEQYHVSAFSMLIAAMFSAGKYNEIIELVNTSYRDYVIEKDTYQNLLSMTNFYIGAAYINSGNIPKGAFYMTLASRNASSKAQSDYFDSFIDKISNYL